MCCLYCSSCQFSDGSYSGFLFFFCCFFVVFRKQICFGSEWVAKDKLVFGMFKTWPCVISNPELDPFVVWILGQNLNYTPLIVLFFFLFFIFYHPNFCLGRPFGFSAYQVRNFDLPLGSLQAHARWLSLPQCRALRYLWLSFVMTL